MKRSRAASHRDPSSNGVAITRRSDQLQSKPRVAEFLIIAQKQRRTVYLGHDHIEISVTIEIRVRAAAPNEWLEQIRSHLVGSHANKGPGSTLAFRVPK